MKPVADRERLGAYVGSHLDRLLSDLACAQRLVDRHRGGSFADEARALVHDLRGELETLSAVAEAVGVGGAEAGGGSVPAGAGGTWSACTEVFVCLQGAAWERVALWQALDLLADDLGLPREALANRRNVTRAQILWLNGLSSPARGHARSDVCSFCLVVDERGGAAQMRAVAGGRRLEQSHRDGGDHD